MKKFLTIIFAAMLMLPLSAIEHGAISPEGIVDLLSTAGYEAYVDQDGDAVFFDEYGMEYWIFLDYPDADQLMIQSAWAASAGVTIDDANRIANESNRMVFTIRCYFEPLYRTFFADYTLPFSERGLDDEAFIKAIDSFVYESDLYTDHLLAEGAL